MKGGRCGARFAIGAHGGPFRSWPKLTEPLVCRAASRRSVRRAGGVSSFGVNTASIGIRWPSDDAGRLIMFYRSSTCAFALAAALMVTMGGAQAVDDAKYPRWKGQWNAIVTPGLDGRQFKFDPTKPRGLGQQAPLTSEYQKVLADSMADQANGGLGNYPTARCLPGGMPRMMASQAQEYIITP